MEVNRQGAPRRRFTRAPKPCSTRRRLFGVDNGTHRFRAHLCQPAHQHKPERNTTMSNPWDHHDHDPTGFAGVALETRKETPIMSHVDDIYTDWAIDIDQHRIELTTALNTALAALAKASTAIA